MEVLEIEKYAWRNDCYEAAEYDLDPENYETKEEYEEALNEAKIAERKSVTRRNT